jgi:hypothetical protein
MTAALRSQTIDVGLALYPEIVEDSPTSRSGANRWSRCFPRATRSQARRRSGSMRSPPNRCFSRATSPRGCRTCTSTYAEARASSRRTATSLPAPAGCSGPRTLPPRRSYLSQFPAACRPVLLPCRSGPRKNRSRRSSSRAARTRAQLRRVRCCCERRFRCRRTALVRATTGRRAGSGPGEAARNPIGLTSDWIDLSGQVRDA